MPKPRPIPADLVNALCELIAGHGRDARHAMRIDYRPKLERRARRSEAEAPRTE